MSKYLQRSKIFFATLFIDWKISSFAHHMSNYFCEATIIFVQQFLNKILLILCSWLGSPLKLLIYLTFLKMRTIYIHFASYVVKALFTFCKTAWVLPKYSFHVYTQRLNTKPSSLFFHQTFNWIYIIIAKKEASFFRNAFYAICVRFVFCQFL